MNLTFYSYFFAYIFKSKTRQKLLFIAAAGLFLSSFSLIVVQSIMGGLQKGLVERSKNVLGDYVLHLDHYDDESYQKLTETLENANIRFHGEYELELLIRSGKYLSGAIVHGIEGEVPEFLKGKNFSSLILGGDLGAKLSTYFDTEIDLISPIHGDSIFGHVPRSYEAYVADYFSSELIEIDSVHGWIPISQLQHITRTFAKNRIVIDSKVPRSKLEYLLSDFKENFRLISWEDKNQSLVWALKLETTMMLFIFVCMSLLVAMAITSGFMIFFNKIKIDLITFWILGKSQKEITKLSMQFSYVVSFIFTLSGLMMGLFFLKFLESTSLPIMPDLFVERSIPVAYGWGQVLISLGVPYLIAAFFSAMALKSLKNEKSNFVTQIRSYN